MNFHHQSNFRLKSALSGPQARGQGMVEFALILPLLLLFIFGVIEAGHMLAIYSGVSSAAKQTARYGSVAGTSELGKVYYLDCAGMRTTAKRSAFLQGLTDSNIQIAYDTGFITSTVGACDSNNVPRFSSSGTQMTSANSEDLLNGGRVVVTITTTYRPIVPLVPIPPLPMTFVAARSIFTAIMGPTPTPRPPPDLALTITDAPDPVAPGDTLTYTLNLTNNGPGIATSIRLTNTLPAGTTFVSVSGSGWTCSQSGGVVTCTRPGLNVGSAPAIAIVVTAPATSGTLTDSASVTSVKGDSNTANNSDTEQTLVISGADLAIGATDTPDPVAPSTTLTYTLNVTNTGTSTANLVMVTDTLPGGVTLQAATGTGWACVAIAGGVRCTRVSLAVGAAPAITVRITAPAITGLITNSATVSSATADPIPENNSASITTTVASDADLSITILDSPDPAGLGDAITYVLRVTNNGLSPANSVVVTNTLPAGVTFVSASGSGWSCSPSGGVVTCSMASLAVGPASDITVLVNAPASAATLTDSASVGSATSDANQTNNSASQTTTVLPCNPNVVSAADSLVVASPAQVQADGVQTTQVVVTLKDSCGNLLANRTVSLASSRGATDTITPGSGTTNATGQITFLVASATTSPYALGSFTPSAFTATSGSTTITQTGSAAFVCVTGVLAPFSGAQDIQYSFSNNSGIDRRLVSLTLTWPSGASRELISVNFSASQIWSGNGNSSPLTLNSGWTAASRTITAGTSKTLQLNFNSVVSGTGTYTLTAQWDDNNGGSICTAPSITVTR